MLSSCHHLLFVFPSKGVKAHQDPRVTGGVAYVGKDIADIQSAVKNMQFQMAAQVNLIFLMYASRNWQKILGVLFLRLFYHFLVCLAIFSRRNWRWFWIWIVFIFLSGQRDQMDSQMDSTMFRM